MAAAEVQSQNQSEQPEVLCTHVQSEPLHERTGLESQLEPLIRVARAHEQGKEEYARNIAKDLFDTFLATEERFAGNQEATEQEIIDAMRSIQVGFVVLGSANLLDLQYAMALQSELAAKPLYHPLFNDPRVQYCSFMQPTYG